MNSTPNSRNTIVLYVLTSLALLGLALLVPRGEDVIRINGQHSPASDALFSTVTIFGDALIFLPVIIFLLFVRFYYAAVASSLWIVSGIVCTLLKRVVFSQALRPVGVLDNTLLHFVPGVQVHSYYSFPSGHTMTIFSITMLAALMVDRKVFSLGMLALALLVGYSRIYLLQHFLMDVAVGGALGTGLTLLFWHAANNIGVPPRLNSRFMLGKAVRRYRYTNASSAR